MFELLEKLKLISKLESVSFEFGVFSEDGKKKKTVKIYNLNDTFSKAEMELSDIMYFVENGTIAIPAKNVLKIIGAEIQKKLSKLIKLLTIKVMSSELDEKGLIKEIKRFNDYINNAIIPNSFKLCEENEGYVEKLINLPITSKTIFNLNELKNFVKCKIIF